MDEEATPSPAARRFYEGTWHTETTLTPLAESRASVSPASPATPVDQVAPELRRRAPAVAAVEDIRRWLSLSYDDVARLVECAPSSIYYWKQRASEGREVRPQTASVIRLFQVHSLLRSISIALGSEDDAGAVSAWAHSPGEHAETPLQLLQSGRVDEANRRAANVIYDRREPAPRPGSVYTPETSDETPPQAPPLSSHTDFEGLDSEDDEFE
jgi:hypothetical protein